MASSQVSYNQIAGQKVQRIEALSDGVFAIALTILVLELHVPVIDVMHSEGEVLAALGSLAPKFIAYFLSFMTLGIFWVGHSAQFKFIEKSDRRLTWISLFFLLFVSVLPFSTAFLGEYLAWKVAVGLYWLNIFALGAALYVHWDYAYRHNLISLEGEEREGVNRSIRRRIVIAQTLYAFAALLCFVSTIISILVIVLIQLNYVIGLFPRPRGDEKYADVQAQGDS